MSVFSPDDGQTLTDLCCSGSRPCFLCAVDREYGQGAPTDVSPHLISNKVHYVCINVTRCDASSRIGTGIDLVESPHG